MNDVLNMDGIARDRMPSSIARLADRVSRVARWEPKVGATRSAAYCWRVPEVMCVSTSVGEYALRSSGPAKVVREYGLLAPFSIACVV